MSREKHTVRWKLGGAKRVPARSVPGLILVTRGRRVSRQGRAFLKWLQAKLSCFGEYVLVRGYAITGTYIRQ